MPNCSLIDPLISPYVDGDLAAADRAMLDEHVRLCAPCRGRVVAERAVRDVIAARRDALCGERASNELRARCASVAAANDAEHAATDADALRVRRPRETARPDRAVPPVWRARLAPFALAAALVAIVAGAFVYQLTVSSTSVMAAELTADHMKCFAVNSVLGTRQTPEIVESALASGFDWRMRVPDADASGLALVGSRLCLYGEGRVAHLMFRHNGTPVSLFMLPHTTRSGDLVRIFGHEAAIWSVGDRTFVLIASETKDEVERLSAFMQASLR